MIQAEHLTKRYGSHLAVDDISFTVKEGTVYGLLGPNGAGKSTTMNILTGYISASSGSVSIDGHDILEEPAAAKACVGYLPEQPPLYPDMTPAEYLAFVAELKKVKRADRAGQIRAAMQRTGVQEVEHRLIKNLSKGYRQRVGLAAALLGEPKVIILDEPTVGLDPAQVIEIRELITELGKEHTVILSSHILSEVSALCDEVLILAQGRLAAQGTPAELADALGGRTTLKLTALGEAGKVLAALEGLAGVQSAELTGEANGETSLRLTAEEGNDLRAAVSAALAAAGCPVLALTTEALSLEEVFLQLTAQEPEEEAESADAPKAQEAGPDEAQPGGAEEREQEPEDGGPENAPLDGTARQEQATEPAPEEKKEGE